ncbi:MAG: hypothetical protein WDM70_07775 [Nitrosomonadales bacterium]
MGHIFGMMTFGGAVMPVYANDLSPTERWNVVNYVRKGPEKGIGCTDFIVSQIRGSTNVL